MLQFFTIYGIISAFTTVFIIIMKVAEHYVDKELDKRGYLPYEESDDKRP